MSDALHLETSPIPPPEELEFATYEAFARQAAFFLEEPSHQSQVSVLTNYIFEETIEALGEEDQLLTTRVLYGLPADPLRTPQIKTSISKEGGDLLYLTGAATMLYGENLGSVAAAGIKKFTGASPASGLKTFQEFDSYMRGRMPEQVYEDYRPDYAVMQLFMTPPYEVEDAQYQHNLLELVASLNGYAEDFQPRDAIDQAALRNTLEDIIALCKLPRYQPPENASLSVTGDGRYALWFGMQALANAAQAAPTPNSAPIDTTPLLSAGGEALAILSAVGQHRLDTSLADMAHGNLVKLQRRARNKTERGGNDPERSKGIGVERTQFNSWDVTKAALLKAKVYAL